MDDRRTRDQAIALAGLFQAVSLVQQVARTGSPDAEPFAVSMESLLAVDADSVEAVYGSPERLAEGLRTLCRQLGNGSANRDAEIMRYAASLLHLERKLVRSQALLGVLRDGIGDATRQVEHFPATHDNVVAKLADIYANTVSTLQPRIMVQGEPEYLRQSGNADRIRALLLSGIRAAVLWRQLGGNRLRLLFSRSRIVRCAHAMLGGK